MSSRLAFKHYPQAMKPLFDFSAAVHANGLEQPLVELILLRVSQLNGCAYCIDMHSKDARAAGETEQRLYLLQAWREAPFYSERECAALAWAEAVTQLGEHGVPEEVFARARAAFSEEELVKLNLVVILINAWNRIAIPFGAVPGEYQPNARRAT